MIIYGHSPSSQAKLSPIFEKMFMLCSDGDGDADILSPRAVQTFSRCRWLNNFLLDGRICITSREWWEPRKVHDEVARAILLWRRCAQSEVEKEFSVRGPPRLVAALTD